MHLISLTINFIAMGDLIPNFSAPKNYVITKGSTVFKKLMKVSWLLFLIVYCLKNN